MILRGVLAISTYLGFDELERYHKTTEKYLQKAASDFKAWVDEHIKTLSEEERDEFFESYSEDHWDYAETFPNIFRKSFFISAYSLLEYKMIFICKWLKKERQIPSNWDDSRRGNALDKFKRYFKHAGLELTDNDWQEINDYRLIRNCIVHNRGFIERSRSEKNIRELLDYATRKNIIGESMDFPEVRPHVQIVLTEQFCRKVTKTIWAFLSKVLEAHELQRQNEKADR